MRRVLGFLLRMSEGGLEAHQGPCGGDGEEAAPHIGPVAQKGNSEASCLGAGERQVADWVMRAQGGWLYQGMGLITSPSDLFRERPNKMS